MSIISKNSFLNCFAFLYCELLILHFLKKFVYTFIYLKTYSIPIKSKMYLNCILNTSFEYDLNSSFVIYIRSTFLFQSVILFKQLTEFYLTTLIDCYVFTSKKQRALFTLCYAFINYTLNVRVTVCVVLTHSTVLQTLSRLYIAAEWLEREVWEFFGVYFLHHSDRRRLLTEHAFEWFPLRKEFPLVGFMEASYLEGQKSLVWDRVIVSGFRFFKFIDHFVLK